MSATLELFERFKQVVGAQADSAGAQALGVKSQTVSNWRTRGSQAEPRLIEKMCTTVHEDLAPWLMRVQMEQASKANRQVWRRVGEKLGYHMAGVAVALCLPAAGSSFCAEVPIVHVAHILARVQEWVDLTIAA